MAACPHRFLHRLTDRQRALDLLREVANGAIYLMSGGAMYYPTFEEWNCMSQRAYTNVPSGFLATIARLHGGCGSLLTVTG